MIHPSPSPDYELSTTPLWMLIGAFVLVWGSAQFWGRIPNFWGPV